jgi:carboxypeptidase C (cathepsin A)
MHRSLTVITSLLLVITAVALYGQQPPSTESTKAQAKGETKAQNVPKAKGDEPGKEKEKPKTSVDEEPIVTHHQLHIDGKDFAYTATAGLMPLKDTKGEVEARVFFVAYTRDDAGLTAARPVLFSFNGGPGSASVWLHLGALGPRRVNSPEEPVIPAPPFHLVDNEATWLDYTDLVFIDPVGTGYSRATNPELSRKFHA